MVSSWKGWSSLSWTSLDLGLMAGEARQDGEIYIFQPSNSSRKRKQRLASKERRNL